MHPSDRQALDKILAVRPILRTHRLARELPGIDRNTILHAGPEFESPDHITVPVMNSACAAVVYEGLAGDFSEARQSITNGTVVLEPAQNYNVVVPLAGVVSASMWLHEIVDAGNSNQRAYAPINGGNGPAMRLGLYSDAVVVHLHWLNGEFMDALQSMDIRDIELSPIAACALKLGDDCHGRTAAGTRRLIEIWKPELDAFPTAISFLNDSPMFFLNLWMAACKCMLSSATGVAHSSAITAAGANGRELGIQVAGLPNRWITAYANPPLGDLGKFPSNRALGAIGDSAIVDAAGFGAMAISYSPVQQKVLRDYLPENALALPNLLLSEVYSEIRDMDFRTGLCARTVSDLQTTPIVGLGILDNQGIEGRLGGGILRYPLDVFEEAVIKLQSE